MSPLDINLYGRKVLVESDHKPLESILKKSILNAPKRLQRMMLKLQQFEFEVEYKKGPLMFLAGILSHATITGSTIAQNSEAGDVMCIQETRSTTEQEIEEIDMLRNLSVRLNAWSNQTRNRSRQHLASTDDCNQGRMAKQTKRCSTSVISLLSLSRRVGGTERCCAQG